MATEPVADEPAVGNLIEIEPSMGARLNVSGGLLEIHQDRKGKDDSPPNTHCDDWGVTLHCYLIGPGRHHTWTGPSLSETLDRAEPQIDQWIAEATEHMSATVTVTGEQK